ncbi:MAG: NAD-glutamate dehydrogenase domain-containing protein [Gammaproteobacteria bacterium]
MKVRLTTGNFEIKSNRQHDKLKSVQYRLESDKNHSNRRFLVKLAEILLFPDSYFVTLPTPLLASLLDRLFGCLENAADPFSIETLSFSGDIHRFIVVNCRNLMHVVDSLLVLQENPIVPFQLLAHPVLSIRRQGGAITALENNGASGSKRLLVILRLDTVDENDRERLLHRIEHLLSWALRLDEDRPRLLEQMSALQAENSLKPYAALLDWLAQGAFIPFAAHVEPIENGKKHDNKIIYDAFCPDCGFPGRDPDAFERALAAVTARSTPLIVQYLPVPSPLIYDQQMVYLGFRSSGSDGAEYEHGFFGVFDETELSGAACKIPFLCGKITAMLASIRSDSNSYEYLQLQEIVNLFPKVDLFLLEDAQIYLILQSLKRFLYRPEGVKLLVLSSPSPYRLSMLVVVPAHLYREDLDFLVRDKLCAALASTAENLRKIVQGGNYVGLHLILNPGRDEISIDVDRLDRDLNRLARPWTVTLRRIMERAYGKTEGGRLWRKYKSAFPPAYQAVMPPRYAVKDIRMMEALPSSFGQSVNLLSPCHRFRLYRLHFFSIREHYLDEYIPILENLNLRVMDQVQFPLEVDGTTVYIKSFSISAVKTPEENFGKLRDRLLCCIQAILDGRAENDVLNSLLVLAGLPWQPIDVLRAYRNYYLQLGFQTTGTSFNHALINNPKAVRSLFDYFDARFRPDPAWSDPAVREEQALFPLRLELLEHMTAVNDINDDKILRTLFNLIDATMRTNFHVRKDLDEYFVSFKINSLGIIEMAPPKPQYEIYVHAFNMEGIHLRGGKISRGGIRWSDRPDDFRTEILGLMQTQMSKNALIIPKGAKGGFVVKRIDDGSDFRAAGKKAYVTLMQGMLDLTDNYSGEQVFKLPGIVSYDDDDPYLVVAADKGTAQFSDLANSVAARYRFWLKEAFASGGSAGYNHKALGITARGAWECVKRHFREIGKDIQREAFTVVGIGSMDGDVFGNGMLLSHTIELKAAISGQHIFIDPTPGDTECSYQERKRLFELPGSSWDDYDRNLISEGGGVFLRNAKDIPISAPLGKWLGIRYKTLDGASLIRYLLTAKVELLWLGGIGTYVKAGYEKNEDVGDRSNDEVRVDANQLRAAVVGEGANLGFTQKARVEYALAGGRINTDAVDNSAGVDTSDHEVNLKILLTGLNKKGLVDDYQQLFTALTSEVCTSVLENNYRQSLCLSLEQLRCRNNAEPFLLLAERLENAGVLDRTVESFAHYKVVMARPEQMISRPEFAVLMAAAKMQLTQELLDNPEAIASEDFDVYPESYFPEAIRRDFRSYLPGHPLAHAIKATVISNLVVNQAGCGFLAMDEDFNGLIDSAVCYLTFDRVLDGDALRRGIYALDTRIEAALQYELLLVLENILAEFCKWANQSRRTIRPDRVTLENYRTCLAQWRSDFDAQGEILSENISGYIAKGVPESLARNIAFISTLTDFPMTVALTLESECAFNEVRRVFDEVMTFLELDKVFGHLDTMTLHDYWERRVYRSLRIDIRQILSDLTLAVLSGDSNGCRAFFNTPSNKQRTLRYQRVLRQICSSKPVNLLPFLALNKALAELAASR